ncbi:MAG: type II toxin-antitoxin system Phd/YefM family antitoxin [Desulfobacteraceae bacterium]|jgi:prevent-host-death family protein
MNSIWKLQDAKAQFSKLVKEALKNGPQVVTCRGAAAVVIVSAKEYETLVSCRPDFKDFLLSCPRLDETVVFERRRDYPRSTE